MHSSLKWSCIVDFDKASLQTCSLGESLWAAISNTPTVLRTYNIFLFSANFTHSTQNYDTANDH